MNDSEKLIEINNIILINDIMVSDEDKLRYIKLLISKGGTK